MKMAAVMVVAVMGGSLAAAQGTSPMVKDDLFSGTEKFAKGASDVTEVTMDPETLGMVSGDNSRRARGMVLNVVRTYEYDKPGMYNIADVEQIRQRLNTGDWHCSVHTQDLKHGESTDICNKHRTDGLVEQAIITVEPKELTFIHTIKHEGSRIDMHREGGAGESMLMGPDLMGSQMEVQMAVTEAKMEAMEPVMEARMAAIGPEVEARMAGVQARMSALGGLGLHGMHGSSSSAWHGGVPKMPKVPPAPEAPEPPAVPAPPALPPA